MLNAFRIPGNEDKVDFRIRWIDASEWRDYMVVFQVRQKLNILLGGRVKEAEILLYHKSQLSFQYIKWRLV